MIEFVTVIPHEKFSTTRTKIPLRNTSIACYCYGSNSLKEQLIIIAPASFKTSGQLLVTYVRESVIFRSFLCFSEFAADEKEQQRQSRPLEKYAGETCDYARVD